MRNWIFICAMIIVFAVETAVILYFLSEVEENSLNPVEVNEAVQSVRGDWYNIAAHVNRTELDYTVLDGEENVIYRTKTGLSENVNAAVSNRDTILDIEAEGTVVGKIIIYNDSSDILKNDRSALTKVLGAAAAVQVIFCVAYAFYLNRVVARPFRKMKGFAERVAVGNLDIPLEMDRGNLFGAFTESFDIMRSELKKSRLAEAKANASKKELVAKLSHDIRTPVASIKAVSELGAAVAADEKTRENFIRIISKADQISTLVGNLFSATLEELQQLTVTPSDMPSSELKNMLESADYFHRAKFCGNSDNYGTIDIPECMIYADKLRLQQVFDNIFANSYKYADTEIDVRAVLDNGRLAVEIEDHGGGVSKEELPLIKEKFGRGSNAEKVDGAGLGLYISDRFMEEMSGDLVVENGDRGLKITVWISLSGSV